MIPGNVSKVSEGRVPWSPTIKVENDLVFITGGIGQQIQTINPGLGTAQGQFLMLCPLDGTIGLGVSGNILSGNGLVMPRGTVTTLIYSKLLQKWIGLSAAADIPPVALDTTQLQFISPQGGTWTVTPAQLSYFYYNQTGRYETTITGLILNSTLSKPDATEIQIQMPANLNIPGLGEGVWNDQGSKQGFVNYPGGGLLRILTQPGQVFNSPTLSILFQISVVLNP